MYKNVLLPIDLDDDSSWKKALPVAVELHRAFQPTIHVLTVVPSLAMGVSAYLPDDTSRKLIEGTTAALATFVKDNLPATIAARQVVAQGTVYHVILEVATNVGADVIVMAAHRPALSDYLLGPNAARVVRHASCSVLVVRE